MGLDLAFGIARTGLLATQRALAQVSDNIANADTPGASRKERPAIASSWGEQPMGVRLGPAARQVDTALVDTLLGSRADAAAARTRERLLANVEAAQGRPEDGDTLGDAVDGLRAAFLDLRAAPEDPGLQRQVVEAARNAAARFRDVAGAVASAREEAQRGLEEEVRRANGALREVADLTDRIRADQAGGLSTAWLEDQRDAALGRLSESLPVRVLRASDGGVTLLGRNGLALPLDKERDAFSIASFTGVTPASHHGGSGGLPGVMLGGVDVTTQLSGGRLGEYARLRDQTLPRFQAELDVTAAALAARSEAMGLRLFTDAAGGVPDVSLPYADTASGQVGFAGGIRLAAAVEADPRLVRDGTHAVPAGTATQPTAFTPNPAGGPAGFAVLVDRMAGLALGEELRPGVPWSGFPATGLGPDGSLASPVVAARSVAGFAAALTGAQSAERAAATEAGERAERLSGGLEARLTSGSGIDTDAEMARMVQLQNAYAANARVMGTVQQMWDQLLALGR